MKLSAAVLSLAALSLVAVSGTTACSSTEGITPDPATTDGGAPGAEPAATRGPNDPVSGSRLLVRYSYFQMEDGSKERRFAGFYDTKLDTMCAMATGLDGDTTGIARCVPLDPTVQKQHVKDEYQIGRVDLSP